MAELFALQARQHVGLALQAAEHRRLAALQQDRRRERARRDPRQRDLAGAGVGAAGSWLRGGGGGGGNWPLSPSASPFPMVL